MIDLDFETQTMYMAVATELARRVKAIFASEDTLKETFAKYFSQLPFDRTERWNTILKAELRAAWKIAGPPTGSSSTTLFDEAHILHYLFSALMYDYNLFTQVLLNIQPSFLLNYRMPDAEATVLQLSAKWEGKSPSPFDSKPRMFKMTATEEEIAFNRDLSTLKAMRIVAALTFSRSYRVSPIGTTPALTDSQNLSMLGVGGDQYLALNNEDRRAYYFCWDQAPERLTPGEKPGLFTAESIPYPFESKTGGQILNATLFAREVAAFIYYCLPAHQIKVVLPRMNSVLLVTDLVVKDDSELLKRVENYFPMVRMHRDSRPDPTLAAAE